MDGLNIVRVIVSPTASHAARADMVRHDVAIIREVGAADAAFSPLDGDFSIEQLPHFRIRAEFAISPWVLGILDSSDAQLSGSSCFWDRFPAAAGLRTVDRADLIAT
ncbi:MAG: hypothetical protein WBQ94_19995 [Terracidiphilus sp.]